jgi:hypothetical protein
MESLEVVMALDVQEITGTKAAAAARLCNFATGRATLLPAHLTWLDTKVRPVVAGNSSAWVDVISHASRQWKHTEGANSHKLNRALSAQRGGAVKSRVSSYNPAARFNVVLAQGDSQSLMPNPDDGYDRAVEVFVYASGPPPRVPPVAPPPVQALNFEIRVVGGGSASAAVVQADNYFFQIVDLVRRKTAFYFYTGLGRGISFPELLPGSVTKAGPPTRFRTTRHTELYQFNSRASLGQDPGVTVGCYSRGGTLRLAIKDIQDSAGLIFTIPSTIPIGGGCGFQMSGLEPVSEGVLAWQGQLFPFMGY